MIVLNKHEKVISVVPEFCSGPGYSNWVVWVHIVDYSDKTYRCHALQDDEFTPSMHALMRVGAAMTAELLKAVPTKTKGKK